jgi:hypothetical protein
MSSGRYQLPAGPGRPPGLANKATSKAREAIAQLVDDNAHRLLGWLDRVAEDDPAEAFKLFQSVIEYHIPKLQRTDTTITGEITVSKVEFIRPVKVIEHDA